MRSGTQFLQESQSDSDAGGPHSTLSKAGTPGLEEEVGGCRCGDVRGSSRDTLGSAGLAASHLDSLHITDGEEETRFAEGEFQAGQILCLDFESC